jgi:transcriptional regulator with XRE-family HTH domain
MISLEKGVIFMTIGEKIKHCRKLKKLTQKELGERCGIAEPTIRKYESGRANPKIVTIKKISLALDMNVHYFLDLDPNDETLWEKLIGTEYKQIKAYADAFDMDLTEFILKILKHGIEVYVNTRLFGQEPNIKEPTLAELYKLKTDNPQTTTEPTNSTPSQTGHIDLNAY